MIDNKTKLVFITYQFITGGVERVFINMARHLKRPLYLMTIKESYDEIIKQLPSNVVLIDFKQKEKTKGIYIFVKKLLFLRFNRRFRNRLTINFSDTLSTLLLSFLSSGKKTYTWIHCSPLALHNSHSFILYMTLIKNCDKIICLCNQQLELLIKVSDNKINKLKCRVCYNLIDNDDINKKKIENLDINFKYFLTVSRLDLRSKDFFSLVDAYCLLNLSIQNNYKLVIIGDGPNRETIQNYISEKGVGENILLPGKKINPYNWMQNAVMLLHSSKSEGYPLVLQESMTCGIPVISSDCPVGPREILDNGKYGLLFEVGDAAKLKDNIEYLIFNNEHLEYYKKQSALRSKMLVDIAREQLNTLFQFENQF